MTYELQGRYAEAEKSLREGRAIGLKSKNVAGDDELSYSHLLFIASHNPSIGPAELYAEHRQYGEAIEGPRRASWPRHANPREPERRLKVGFVSGDLHEHSVGQFLEPIVARLKTRPGLELHAYRTNPVEDALSRRLQSHFRSWTSVGAFTDDRLASKIQEDKIDVLIDLSGHTGHNRLPVFARKPAPVQVSWLGYPGTTGLGAMDYYLADRCWLPPGRFDGMFTEKLVYLPDRWAFRTHADAPAVGPLPALETGALTFGSFHRLGKINAATVELWSRLLLALPRSILRVAGIPVNGPQQALLDQFAAHGIGPERVTCHARSTMDVYLAFHNQVDIALDTLAYSGATTTMHSLSMGVPTLTVAGATPQARACAGILTNLGLEAFVAADAADFLDKARHWAGRLGELAELRRQLRARVQRSPGGQPEFIAAHLEAAMRHMWRGWCANLPPRVFDTSLLERPADAVLAGAAAPAGPAVATGVPWQSIPIILNNRNRFDSLRRMVDWLLAAGCRDIRILDNDSEYAPLLAYYAALPGRVTVQKLGENIGPWAFWKLGLHRLMSTPYIVSDADLVPADYCPTDLIARLAAVADRYPDCGKVAPGLRLDTISPAYGQSRAAFQWESRYWSKPVAPGLFAAPVDTTFALYQPGAEFTIRGENLRLGHPYLLEHMPWQVDESALGEEELFYRAHTSKAFSHWSSSTIDPRIAANKWIRQFSERKTVLHLGCGDEYIPGWINIDAQGPRCDIRFDIENCAGQRLPLADDSADGFYLCHVFHRVKDPLALMQELHRVARPGATIHMRLPYGSSDDAWADGAARPYFDSSFTRFSGPAHRSGGRDYAADWQPTRVTLIVDPALLALGREEALRQIRAGRNQVAEMVVELTAVKPARPCSPGSPIPCEILLSSDQRVPPVFHEMEDL